MTKVYLDSAETSKDGVRKERELQTQIGPNPIPCLPQNAPKRDVRDQASALPMWNREKLRSVNDSVVDAKYKV